MAAAAGPKPGIKGGAYKNGGTFGSPTWAIMSLVRDATPQWVWDFAEAFIRATRVKLYAKTMVDLGGPLVMRADDADTAYQAMVDASFSATSVVDLLLLDGLITSEGARGIRGEFLVGAEPQNQEIGGIIYTTFQLKPAFSSNGYPTSVSMGASSTPTLTAF